MRLPIFGLPLAHDEIPAKMALKASIIVLLTASAGPGLAGDYWKCQFDLGHFGAPEVLRIRGDQLYEDLGQYRNGRYWRILQNNTEGIVAVYGDDWDNRELNTKYLRIGAESIVLDKKTGRVVHSTTDATIFPGADASYGKCTFAKDAKKKGQP